jgi:hypothetical protein
MAAQGAAARPTLIAPTTRDTTPNTTPEPDRSTIATAVRYLLEELESRAPGRTLEVRIPPFGAVQCLEGPRHTRGTPPGVVEMDAHTWLAIATGSREWHEALASGDVKASGERANLAALLPLMTPPKE